MIVIDGNEKSGSGTIVRDAVPFAVLKGEDLRIFNIRAKRKKPGLRPQHLKAVEAAARICSGRVEGAEVGAGEILFRPGRSISGGSFHWDIGSAGSAVMLALSILPLSLFADAPSEYRILGGLFQDFAPSVYHFNNVLLPLLRRMGAEVESEIICPGYVPRGGGEIRIRSRPLRDALKPILLLEQGKILTIKGIALSSMLRQRKVSERIAREFRKRLKLRGYPLEIESLYDSPESPVYQRPALQAGASFAVWARTEKGCILGSDMAGAPGRTAEFIGRRTAENLTADLDSGATVDTHVSDQLIPFCALARGRSSYLIPRMTDHIESRLWLAQKIHGAETELRQGMLSIDGIGYVRS